MVKTIHKVPLYSRFKSVNRVGNGSKDFSYAPAWSATRKDCKQIRYPQRTLSDHLAKMPSLAIPLNADLLKGFTVPQIAEKHGQTEPMVWSIALKGKSDLDRFKALNWGLRTWDQWNFNECLPREIHVNDKQSVFHKGDKRFGDDWPARHRSRPKEAVSTAQGVRLGEAGGPGRIPAQMIAHILDYFSDQNDLLFDPMAGGGVVADTCLAFNRKCWSFDMDDRPDTRPEIEPRFWDITNLKWPIKGKTKPDLIIFDPKHPCQK